MQLVPRTDTLPRVFHAPPTNEDATFTQSGSADPRAHEHVADSRTVLRSNYPACMARPSPDARA